MPFGMGGMGGPSVFSFGADDDGDEELPGMFGAAHGAHRGRRNHAQHQEEAAENIKRKLPVSLEELYSGFQKKLKVTKKIQDASGSVTTASNIITIDGRPGWKAGVKVTFAGAGDELNGRPAQDLTFIIEEKPHPVFKREGDDLIAQVKVPLVDALCGYRLGLTGIDKKQIVQTVPRVTPAMELTLPGEGMPRKAGGRGNLRIKFDVEFPTASLSDKQKEELRRILK